MKKSGVCNDRQIVIIIFNLIGLIRGVIIKNYRVLIVIYLKRLLSWAAFSRPFPIVRFLEEDFVVIIMSNLIIEIKQEELVMLR